MLHGKMLKMLFLSLLVSGLFVGLYFCSCNVELQLEMQVSKVLVWEICGKDWDWGSKFR